MAMLISKTGATAAFIKQAIFLFKEDFIGGVL